MLAADRPEHKRIVKQTQGVIFLGVPHFGTKAYLPASLLACTAYWRGSSTTLLETMSLDNPRLRDLDNEFRFSYRSTYICNFLESQAETIQRLSLSPVSKDTLDRHDISDNPQTVDKRSGELGYAKNVYLNTDHRGLNKFKSATDPLFLKFHRHFKEACQHKN